MNLYVKLPGAKHLQQVRIIETMRGREARSPQTGHLLGVLNEAGQLEIKVGRDEYFVVEAA